jgi:hypothetical protein
MSYSQLRYKKIGTIILQGTHFFALMSTIVTLPLAGTCGLGSEPA